MRKILLVLSILGGLHVTYAQERTVSGKVAAVEDGQALPGVNVVLKGSTIGTVTDLDGNYTLSTPAAGGTLVFSFIGLATEEVEIGSKSVIDVRMTADVRQLNEVVVTAQGFERDVRSLGYATQNIKSDVIAQRSEPNVLNALQGKVSGVNITSSSGAPGASTNINIRGITSFSGSNQPLIVVDGIIMSNATDNTANTLFSAQASNRLGDIDPETIESINVLKGPAASVLYGSRAAAGALIITTKSGTGMDNKTEVTVNSSLTYQEVTGLPDLQNSYGQGLNNVYVPTTTNSWGPRFGTPGFETVVNTQGETVPFQAFPDNINDFYETGRIVQNSVNIASGNNESNYILSLAHTDQEGTIPNTEFTRTTVGIGGNTVLNNGLKVGGKVNYVRSAQLGSVTGNGGSAFGQITRIPRSFDLIGRPFQNELGESIYYSTTQNHPLWSLFNETTESNVDRFFGNFNMEYDIKDWLSAKVRVTADTYTDRRNRVDQIGSSRNPAGRVEETTLFRSELNLDFFLRAFKSDFLMDGLSASAMVAMNVNQRDFQDTRLVGESLTIPFFENISNASIFTSSESEIQKRRLIGYYTQVNFDYKEWLFLELQGRLDRSSTLPEDESTFFYPGVSVSFVPTDALDLRSDVISYVKVRGSFARVGLDADPYLLNSVFVSSFYGNNVADITFPINVGGVDIPGFQVSSRVGNSGLRPEFTNSWEGGLNFGLFNNRISLDAAYFFTESEGQILNVTVAPSSGFSTRTDNVGRMTNQGIELLLNASVVDAGDFNWDLSFNWTRIRNEVTEVVDGVDNSRIVGNGFIGIAPSIAVGEPYGVVIGGKFPRNANGELLINPNTGTFQPTESGQVVADVQPDWLGGITNTFSYKGVELSVLFDLRKGGDIYSFEMSDLRSGGSLELQGENREEAYILPGVIENADGTFRPNNIQLSAQSYYRALGGLGNEGAVFDGSVYRLREVALSYRLPKSLLTNTPFGSVSVGFSGRNLWFFAPNYPGDPEGNSQGAGNIQGVRLNGPPSNPRNYSFNLRFTL
ncbi:SusC/RagA family TonB-linked outer membrane protein [Fulvivirga sp. M361]|uniref:SusC/RagA family TonB-linked outer membrane protein n=1 Tax=Fulvivirga sp. M361 TaxID=2594266 RepID=UPI00117BAD00|nr:SusC/RagA family TonB-linked outer membrane protein [Fulvivirga sp. M361]TRX60807.1 SusC/RagA family TonB-linked outer membrane protein [Fulvivirga sp. M361]